MALLTSWYLVHTFWNIPSQVDRPCVLNITAVTFEICCNHDFKKQKQYENLQNEEKQKSIKKKRETRTDNREKKLKEAKVN